MLGPLSWVLIYVNDVKATTHFYEKILGLPLKYSSASKSIFRTGSCRLHLMGQHDNGPTQKSEKRGWERNRILISFHVADLKAEIAAIESRGGHCLSGIRPTVSDPGQPQKGWLAQFMDPEGNIVEICEEPLD